MSKNYRIGLIKHILRCGVWTIVGLYFSLLLLANLPSTKHYIAQRLSVFFSDKIGSRVEIANIDLGLFNRVVLSDIVVFDHDNCKMLSASRISAKISLTDLFNKRLVVSSAQLFDTSAQLYKFNKDDSPNYQFLIDSLVDQEKTSQSQMPFIVKSLIVRRGMVKYDVKCEPATPGRFNLKHVDLRDISGHFQFESIPDRLLDVKVKRLSLRESSGLIIKSLSLDLTRDVNVTKISNLNIKLPGSLLHSDLTIIRQVNDTKTKQPGLFFETNFFDSYIAMSDLSFLSHKLNDSRRIFFRFNAKGTDNYIKLAQLYAKDKENGLILDANIRINDIKTQPAFILESKNVSFNQSTLNKVLGLFQSQTSANDLSSRVGDLSFKGTLKVSKNEGSVSGSLDMSSGNCNIYLKTNANSSEIAIAASDLQLNKLLKNNDFGSFGGDVRVKSNGRIEKFLTSAIQCEGSIKTIEYKQYPYSNIQLNGSYQNQKVKGQVNINDENGVVSLAGNIDFNRVMPKYEIEGRFSRVSLKKMNLSHVFDKAIISGTISVNASGTNLNNLNGKLLLEDFIAEDGSQYFKSGRVELAASNNQTTNHINFNSDFAKLEIEGIFNYNTLVNSFKKKVLNKLSTVALFTSVPLPLNNNLCIKGELDDAHILSFFKKIPLRLNTPIFVEANINDALNQFNLVCTSTSFAYNDKVFEDAAINISSDQDTLHLKTEARLFSDGGNSNIIISSKAADNVVYTDVSFAQQAKHVLSGRFSATTDFYQQMTQHTPIVHSVIHPSNITFDNEIYNIEPSDIVYSNNKLLIDHFAIANKNQRMILSGLATSSEEDTVSVSLENINIGYLSDILNVKGVDFSGSSFGKISLTSLLHNPRAKANLRVDDFKFSNGTLGTLYAEAYWNAKNNIININGLCDDGPLAKTLVDGYVSLSPDEIDLNINTQNTQIDFLQSYIGSFLNNIKARSTGQIRIFGPLKAVNLEGKVVASGDVDVVPLNATYSLSNDTVIFIPNRMIFRNNHLFDQRKKDIVVNGDVFHHNLSNFTYDMNVEANDVLAFNRPDFGDETFCGTIYASGSCHIVGIKGETDIDIDVTPTKGSIIKYNVSSPNSIRNQEFIQWSNKLNSSKVSGLLDTVSYSARFDSVKNSIFAHNEKTENKLSESLYSNSRIQPIVSNLYMNFLINATPNLTLRLIMDEETGDFIDLHGNGMIQANYFNKGSFDMFGNYLVESGTYRMTIQNFIKKEFTFLPGSSIVFGGDPYYASVDLHAQYPINSVSLADFNIGNSFSSNNVKVNCLMNIGGTAMSPVVDFDFEMPTASSGAEQMVRSIINSEEELNQQVIYLLTIGRFYNQLTNNAEQNANAPSQTSLAMQSLLSGTLSQQINNVLSSVLSLNNWNFGANISTGTEGFNNAEYEGLLEGRLFNNRLLVNGQFGYRDNANATTSFIGDFDVRYLLQPNGNIAVKVYNQTSDRYFTRNSLATQGIGLILKKDFNGLLDLFGRKSRKNSVATFQLLPDSIK